MSPKFVSGLVEPPEQLDRDFSEPDGTPGIRGCQGLDALYECLHNFRAPVFVKTEEALGSLRPLNSLDRT